jgi:hypothetical protein
MKLVNIASISLAGLLACLGCSRRTCKLDVAKDRAEVDCRVLGEYPTEVDGIVLRTTSENPLTVWEVRKVEGTPQLHGFRLILGNNPTELEGVASGRLSAVMPPTGSFELRPGTQYEIEVRTANDRIALKQEFRLER